MRETATPTSPPKNFFLDETLPLVLPVYFSQICEEIRKKIINSTDVQAGHRGRHKFEPNIPQQTYHSVQQSQTFY